MEKPQNMKEALKSDLTKKELSFLPKSFDLIGSIAIFSEFPKELEKKEKVIAQALINIHPNIKTVAKKTKTHSGIYRLKKVKILAGKKSKETLHKESNVLLKLNIETCYFSPRSSNERLRIASLIKKNESVLVMFSGIAVFPLVISKNSKAKEIYAVEINPVCHKYAEENIKLNKVSNIKLYEGDVNKILPKINKKFDRILMPLPKDAYSFLPLALKKIKHNGIIHLYDFANKNEIEQISYSRIKGLPVKIIKTVKCGQYSPHVFRICFDLKLSK